MRTLISFLYILIPFCSFSQSADFDLLLQQGKKEFFKDFELQDYETAVEKLEKAVKLKPENAEAHYFLGYAYSRLNSKDGKGMIAMNLPLTIKSSEQFEIVNKLSPKYDGELVMLDPYSKLTAEWGSMAMSYWHNKQTDSAVWAFKEGKKRGGFGEFYLSINRKVLDFCSQNSILISAGDNFTLPLWYLQVVEKHRADVTVIDISLLNTLWYPKYLTNNSTMNFGFSNQELDSIEFIQWSDSVITINTSENINFSWTLKPSIYEKYLIRGDRLFLNLLINNKFNREVFFTTGFIEEYRLNLKNHLKSLVVIDKLNYNKEQNLTFKEYNSKLTSALECLKNLNPNSNQELNLVYNLRFDMLLRIYDYLENKEKKEAKKIMKIIDKKISPEDFPFLSEQSLKFYEYLKEQIKKKQS